MKNIIYVVLLLCTTVVFGQKKPKIKGSKVVVEVNEVLPAFSAIKLIDDLKIEVKRSREESFTIVGDDNLIDVLQFEVKDSVLYISSFYKITSKKKLDILINYYDVNTIIMEEGRIEMTDVLSTDYLEVQLQGSSKLILNAQATEIGIVMAGNSDAEMNIDCDVTRIKLDEKSDLKVYAKVEDVQLNMHGNASAKIEGAGVNFAIDAFGNAQLRAEEFKSSVVNANLDDSPDIKIFAVDSLNLSSKGASKTYLYGNPKISLVDFLNTSQLIKKE